MDIFYLLNKNSFILGLGEKKVGENRRTGSPLGRHLREAGRRAT